MIPAGRSLSCLTRGCGLVGRVGGWTVLTSRGLGQGWRRAGATMVGLGVGAMAMVGGLMSATVCGIFLGGLSGEGEIII